MKLKFEYLVLFEECFYKLLVPFLPCFLNLDLRYFSSYIFMNHELPSSRHIHVKARRCELKRNTYNCSSKNS